MIRGNDVYKVVAAMVPLYTAILLGYASIKRWRMFKPGHCDALNRFNFFFIIPFFTFEFTANVDPYKMNYRFFAADVISKVVVGAVLVVWANFTRWGSFGWSIITFTLVSLCNELFVGVPLLQAMYGDAGRDIAVQAAVIQFLLWCGCLLFLLELRRAKMIPCESDSPEATEMNGGDAEAGEEDSVVAEDGDKKSLTFWGILKTVGEKLAKNPNSYACILGIVWALISKRWGFEMPKVIEGSISIMSKGGAGLAMFSMGVFMALQERIISCSKYVFLYAMALKFVISPATTAVGGLIVGLNREVLPIVVIQAAVPPALATFVYHQEYALEAQVLSTAVTFGTVISLPVLIGYYAFLDIWRH